MLAEVTATSISKQESPTSFNQNKDVARRGGKVEDVAKKQYEEETKTKAITSLNAKNKISLEIKNNKKK